jgi:hypothetical protein
MNQNRTMIVSRKACVLREYFLLNLLKSTLSITQKTRAAEDTELGKAAKKGEIFAFEDCIITCESQCLPENSVQKTRFFVTAQAAIHTT